MPVGFLVFLAIVLLIAYFGLSRRGRTAMITRRFGEIVSVHDLGTNRLGPGTQTLRVLECQKDLDTVFVLEVTSRGIGAFRVTWTALDQAALDGIAAIARDRVSSSRST